MPNSKVWSPATVPRDLTAGMVVFLVALPLCLGVAQASNAPSLIAGIVAGIVGGVVVGILSGSHTSVAGPAAGLTAIVAAQIADLHSFEAFLLAVVIAGVIQIALGLVRAGFIAAFFPSAVIKGLLAAIGVILILKQFPHLFGHDAAASGEFSFLQQDERNTFTEVLELLSDLHGGATAIGLISIGLLYVWDRFKPLKKSVVPAPFVVVLLGVGLTALFERLGDPWAIGANHLVNVPQSDGVVGFFKSLPFPDFSQLAKAKVYTAGLTIALVASL